MTELIKRKVSELQIGDVSFDTLERYNTSPICPRIITSNKFPNDVRACGTRVWYNFSASGGCTYGCTADRDWEIDIIREDDAKIVGELYNEFVFRCSNYKRKKWDSITGEPIFYINDTSLNIELNYEDVLMKKDTRYPEGLDFIVLRKDNYGWTLEDTIPQEELFYEWLTESGKSYDLTFRGAKVSLKNTFCQYHEGNSSLLINCGISAKELMMYKIDPTILNEITDFIDETVREYYLGLREVYEKYYEKLPPMTTKNWKGETICY